MTLVFASTFCYTGIGAKMSKPCAQITIAIDEPRYQKKEDSYKQEELAIHDIPFGYCERLSNRKYIMRIHVTSFHFSALPRDSTDNELHT